MINSKIVLGKTIAHLKAALKDLEKCSIEKVQEFLIPSSVLFNDGEAHKIFNELSKMKGRFIYVITNSGTEKSIDTIKKTYIQFDITNKPRVVNRTFNISRFNKLHSTKTLYVGTSKSIKTRIKQHFGYGSKKTYSMDLIHWFPKNIDIHLSIYKVSTTNHFSIELIEQAIWDIKEPQFGKRSGL